MALAVAMVLGIVGSTAAGCGSTDGVVGGDCAVSYTQCGYACYDLQNDPNNCGACFHKCGPGIACIAGVCQGTLGDGAFGDDGQTLADGQTPGDGTVGDGDDDENCDANTPGCHRPHKDGGDSGDDDDGSPFGDGSRDGTGDDGFGGDGNGGDGNGGDGNGGDGSTDANFDNYVDAPPADAGDASTDAPIDSPLVDACTPPYNTAAHCGSCTTSCAEPDPVCSLEDGGYACVPLCTAPLTDCSNRCVNLIRDPDNCGKCGIVCASRYCFLGTCQGAIAGNIIVIGHDFSNALPTDPETKLLTNSVLYNPPTIRLLSFEHYVDAPTVANAKSLVTGAAAAQHDTLTITVTNDDSYINTTLSILNEDAVIIWDQPNAPTGKLGTLGKQWATALTKFAEEGGIVIVLDAAQGTAEMPALETNGALLAVTGHTVVAPGTTAQVPSGLGIGRQVTSVYLTGTHSASFTTSEVSNAQTLFVANIQGQPTQLLAVQKTVN